MQQDFLNIRYEEVLASEAGATYLSLQRLGMGGSAETYLVLATSGIHSGLLFAAKVFRRLSRPEWRVRFLQEISFLPQCNHPAVMRVFDQGTYLDQHPFVVAEYLPLTLASVIRSTPRMAEKLSYAVQLLSALSYLAALERPVVHRDIKPANIFIKGGSCVIGDFGLMKRITLGESQDDKDLEWFKASVGPRMPRFYRTPDLVEYYVQGRPVPTPKSDIYQLGLVLAELFSGRNPQVPISGDAFDAPVQREDLRYLPGDLGKPIKDAIERMLVHDRDQRPSASELLPQWHELLRVAAKRTSTLEGRVF